MKKIFALFIVLCLALPIKVSAEETLSNDNSNYNDGVAKYSLEELLLRQNELLSELNKVNQNIGNIERIKSTTSTDGTLGKLKDIFPDEALAMVVRDAVGKFSIEQTVTQEELDSIHYIQLFSCEHGNFKDLTGIGFLRNLKTFSLYNSMEYENTFLPDEFYTLTKMESIELHGSNLNVLSEKIGNLTELRELDIGNTDVSELPETIGNLKNLKTLDIGRTKITSLPDSIWGLNLEEIDMAELPIK